MPRRRRRPVGRERYVLLNAQVGQAEAATRATQTAFVDAREADSSPDAVQQTYKDLCAAAQEPLPAEPALDANRPEELSRRLSALRTHRQWFLMDAPPGALPAAAVRPTSRAALGPHVSGLDADFAERQWGVDLTRVVDEYT